jgi:putative molybdopterin biosynthesis protein
LASRPSTAGERAHWDRVLGEEGLDPAAVHEGALICGSHRDVALAVLSGKARVGLLTVAWAARAGLSCLPIADEDYGISLRRSELEREPGRALVRTLHGAELKRQLARAAGYQPGDIGSPDQRSSMKALVI